MLDEIEISETHGWFAGLCPEPYSLKYERGEDKYYFSHDSSNDKVYAPEKEAKEIFDELEKLDYMKIIQAASRITGCDGSFLTIKLSFGMHTLTLSLWELQAIPKTKEIKKLISLYDRIQSLAHEARFNNYALKKREKIIISLD